MLDPVELPEKEEHIHTYGEWESYGQDTSVYCEERLYYRICSGCSDFEWRKGNYEDHRFQNEYSFSEEYHWIGCENCDIKSSLEEHSAADSGYCSVCDNPDFVSDTKGIVYRLSDDNTYAIVSDYQGVYTKVNIAREYGGVPVKHIASNALNNDNIEVIIIPDTMTEITRMFGSNLKSIIVDENNTEYKDIDGNLYTKDGRTLLYYAGGKSDSSFAVPNHISHISSSAFYNCPNLQSLNIPDSVTSIGDHAFDNCPKLTSITVDESNTKYKDIDGNLYTKDGQTLIRYAIGKTDQIFNIPDGVTVIATRAFENCSSLKTLIVPGSVIKIEAIAFSDCAELTDVYYAGTESDFDAIDIKLANDEFTNATRHYM